MRIIGLAILVLANSNFANASETAGQMAMRAWKVLECGVLAGEVSAYCSDPDTNQDFACHGRYDYQKAWEEAFAQFLKLARESIDRATDFSNDEEYKEKFWRSAPIALSLIGMGPSTDFTAGLWFATINDAVLDDIDEDLVLEYDDYDEGMSFDTKRMLQVGHMERQYSAKNCELLISQ